MQKMYMFNYLYNKVDERNTWKDKLNYNERNNGRKLWERLKVSCRDERDTNKG